MEQRSAAETTLAPTVFHESWWLDAASDGAGCAVEVEQGGRLAGRFPFQRRHRGLGLGSLGQPPLTYVLGPAIAPLRDGRMPAPQKGIAITRDLIKALPRTLHASFRLHRDIGDTLAFEVEGFRTRVDYTVEIDPADEAALWRGLRDKTRNVIRRAGERLAVAELEDEDAFLRFYEDNLRRRERRSAYRRTVASGLIAEARRHRSGRLLGATDAAGALQAAIFTVWDRRAEYYLMSTRRPDSLAGANSLLIWHALRRAGAAGRLLDMAGLHVHPGALPNLLLLTGFGGAVRPRFVVERSARPVALARGLVGR